MFYILVNTFIFEIEIEIKILNISDKTLLKVNKL